MTSDRSYRQPGVVLTDHHFTVPLDHAHPDGESIELYAREAVATGRDPEGLPWLLYLEGGPGFGARRFIGRQAWLGRALAEYRVLLLDQRGTGRSTPVSRQTLPLRGTPAQQAAYLAHFRADAIVRDCEAIRPQLTGGAPWTVLGQSFGGFCATRYLSTAPEGLAAALLTGGLPSLDATADEVYRAAYPRIERKNLAHYARYPADVERARRIAAHLAETPVRLPGGYRLTVEAFQSLGILLGTGDGSHQLHYLLEDAFVPTPDGPALSDAFLEGVHAQLSFAGHPLYALVHEALYAQDPAAPTAWAAERVRAEHPRFDAAKTLAGDEPLLFTGETIHPWHFTADPALAPLRETAELLAARTGWEPLYDPARLAANEVPVAAAVYHDDMYVDTEHSLRTARAIRGLRTWVTDEFEHDGVRAGGPRVLDRLLALVRGEA
ncbi:alpha/beta hydrolase [Streptomyces goshikiensis]|uniref:Alpha/beta hydrolase n=1 Tax=Streptomyces goshikiensis TaxID=1942 RepID=A0ABZ1RFA9_9ACTN|nr:MULTISPECIES: alpha/beta fold hydrolase [Streptomyces]PJN20001.1 alpha/beta hydrolase [Streptomyces sp. CB02120-2]WBY23351.1 alpha/beta fold hydrolase [Streptomyces goshikiensis]WSS02245.1 alpha/beta hydrolase [Streptomyces goshikiensis]WSX96533.1 alpha/beta hydrolase [Streptomyces goshikiensis]